jgi:ubiquinone/menaquinone biosynthesis C-methylase UbiE
VGGVSFDRAADYYDATRGLPLDVREAVADILAAELSGPGPCLEIGVGTGRIALPIHARGVALIGADISAVMLGRLVANAGGRLPFPLLLADAMRLPVAGDTCGAILLSHVLHLISDWREAVDEAVRVLRPGGRLLVDLIDGTRAPWSGPGEELLNRHGVSSARPGSRPPQRSPTTCRGAPPCDRYARSP